MLFLSFDFLTPYGFYDEPEEASDLDEVDLYLQEKIRPVADVLAWWEANRERFPRLTCMAFDLLSIPAMSTECERTFSLTKLTVSTQRHSLDSDTIKMLQCLKNWARNGAFDWDL